MSALQASLAMRLQAMGPTTVPENHQLPHLLSKTSREKQMKGRAVDIKSGHDNKASMREDLRRTVTFVEDFPCAKEDCCLPPPEDADIRKGVERKHRNHEPTLPHLYLNFKPGPIGMRFHDETGIVLEVIEGGQAQTLGVKKGMRIRTVDEDNFSYELFMSKVHGSCNYGVGLAHVGRKDIRHPTQRLKCLVECVQEYTLQSARTQQPQQPQRTQWTF